MNPWLLLSHFHLLPIFLVGMGHSGRVRLLAVICYYFAGCQLAKATALFATGLHPKTNEAFCDVNGVKDKRSFIKRTVMRLEDQGDLEDRPRSGAPRKVPDSVIKQCCKELKRGYTDDAGRHWHYSSIEDALNTDYGSPYMRDIVVKYEVVNVRETLWARMLEADSDIGRVYRPAKHKHTDEQKAVRQRVARQRWDMGINELCLWLFTVVWIDAKCGYTDQRGEWVYCSIQESLKPGFEANRNGFPRKKLHFYIAVNALIGPVDIIFVTGTTGDKRIYKVGGPRRGLLYLVLYSTQRP
jgi:transposase